MITARTLVGLLAIGAVGSANAFTVTVLSGVPPNVHFPPGGYAPTGNVRYDADIDFLDSSVPVVVQLEVTAEDIQNAVGGLAEISLAYFNEDTVEWVGFQMILSGAAWATLGNFVEIATGNPPVPATITLLDPQTVDIQWSRPAGTNAYTGYFYPGAGAGPGTSQRFNIDISGMSVGNTFTMEHRAVPIPEPMTVIALASGLAALTLRRRNRR